MVHQLAAAGNQSRQFALDGPLALPWRGLDRLGVAGDHACIDPIRFGQDPKRPGEIAHLARIYHRHFVAGVPESVGQLLFVAARGFCDHQRHQEFLEALDQRPEPGRPCHRYR